MHLYRRCFFILILYVLSLRAVGAEHELRIAYFGKDISSLDSIDKTFDPDSYSITTQIFDSLIHADLDGRLTPGLAIGWKQLSELVWEFQLRQGVTFHNGEEFDASSVKFTFDYILNPQNKTGNAWIFANIKSVEFDAKDKYKVRFTTHTPDGMFLVKMIMFGSIVPAKYIQEKGVDYFHEHPVGTGPFKFESRTRNKEIVLTANESYWLEGFPKLKTIRFLILPESEWLSALENDKVDFVPNLASNLTRKLIESKKANVKIIKRLVLSGYWALLQHRGPLENTQVRKALNHAIDKNALVKFGDYGNAKPIASVGKDGEFGQNKELVPYSYNPKLAREMLKKAGFEKGFKMKAIAADISASVAKIIKQNLKEVGVEVELKIVSRFELVDTIISEKIKNGKPADYDLAIVLVDNPLYHLAFHMGLFLSSNSPWSMIESHEFDKKLNAAVQIIDTEKQKIELEKLDKYVYENALLLFTTQKIITAAVKKNFNIDKFDMDGHLDYELLLRAAKESK